MDRRGQSHRPFLNRLCPGAMLSLLAAGWFAASGAVAHAQTPSAAAPPDAPPARKRAAERMIERRQRELAAGDQEAQRRIDALPPEEREAFKRNLRVWRQLTPEERDAVRRESTDRTREEVERAYQASGLRLDRDQREVFGLRYRQERRKLERELQEKMEAERARRLPTLVEGLKREFADKSAAPATPPMAVTPPPTPAAAPTPSVSVPAAPSSSGH